MNYRHIYHAGNFADVMKHLVLVLCLDYMKQKDKPFFTLDAHGGCGYYDIRSDEAERTGEFRAGAEKLLTGYKGDNPDIRLYLSLISQDYKKNRYPGSPLLIARMLRQGDRLLANELHPEDVRTLRQTLGSKQNVRVGMADAYESIRANLPPQERRGLVLIDPPFEERDEFETLARQMREWKRRWETGCYMIWFPMKTAEGAKMLYREAEALGMKEAWACEFALHGSQHHPDGRPKMMRTGLLVLNPPYTVAGRTDSAMQEIARVLGGEYSSFAI